MRIESENVGSSIREEETAEEIVQEPHIYDERILIRQLGYLSCRPHPTEVMLKATDTMAEFAGLPHWLRGYFFLLVPSIFEVPFVETKWSWWGRVSASVERKPVTRWSDALSMAVKFEFTEQQKILFKSQLVAPKALQQWQDARGESERLDGSKILQVFDDERPSPWLFNSWKSSERVDPEAAVLQSSMTTNFSMGQYHGEDQRLVLHQKGSEYIQVIDSSTLRPRSLQSYKEINSQFRGIPCPNPIFDAKTGQLVNILSEFTKPGKPAKYHVVSITRASSSRRDIGFVIATFMAEPTALETFGVTRDYVIVPICPLTYSKQLPGVQGNIRRGWKSRLSWDDAGDTLFYVIDKRLGYLVAVYRSEACFIFKVANVFNGGNEIFIDVISQEQPPHFAQDELDNLRQENPQTQSGNSFPVISTIRRYALDNLSEEIARFDGAAGQLSHFPLAKFMTIVDYPVTATSINPSYQGLAYRYSYGLTINRENRSKPGYLPNSIVKCDLASPVKSLQWYREGTFPISSPIFIPNPENALGREDDGVLLAVFTEIHRRRSVLMVFDAKDLTVLSSIPLPGSQPLPISRVPGAWQPYAAASSIVEESLALAPLNLQ